MSQFISLISRSGRTVKVNTSDEVFQSLPEKFQHCRKGYSIETDSGVFVMMGIGVNSSKKAIWGQIKGEKGASYINPV